MAGYVIISRTCLNGFAAASGVEIIVNIEASAELNNGGELCGSEAKGYAQYEDGTTEAILRRAYRYFGIVYPEAFGPTWVEPGTWNDTLIWRE